GIYSEIDRLKGSPEVLFDQGQKILAKIVVLLSKESVGDIQRDRFARAAKFLGFLHQFGCLRAHFFQRTLKRSERGSYCAGIAWKVQHTRHFSARLAIRASKRHG